MCWSNKGHVMILRSSCVKRETSSHLRVHVGDWVWLWINWRNQGPVQPTSGLLQVQLIHLCLVWCRRRTGHKMSFSVCIRNSIYSPEAAHVRKSKRPEHMNQRRESAGALPPLRADSAHRPHSPAIKACERRPAPETRRLTAATPDAWDVTLHWYSDTLYLRL